MIIEESGMSFGPFCEEHVFWVEQSTIYRQIQESLKIAEFVLLRKRTNNASSVCIVEAKGSSPKPKNEGDFYEFLEEIHQKMRNTFLLLLALHLKRVKDPKNELSKEFRNTDLSSVSILFILVIRDHEEHWLQPLKDALSKVLNYHKKIWKLDTPVLVLNKALAQKYNLIS